MVSLRDEVAELRQQRREAEEENHLLKQLHSLWERLCYEVEAEIQVGVRKQLGITNTGSQQQTQLLVPQETALLPSTSSNLVLNSSSTTDSVVNDVKFQETALLPSTFNLVSNSSPPIHYSSTTDSVVKDVKFDSDSSLLQEPRMMTRSAKRVKSS